MGKADKIPDASMEEILASIRKIISESGDKDSDNDVTQLSDDVMDLSEAEQVGADSMSDNEDQADDEVKVAAEEADASAETQTDTPDDKTVDESLSQENLDGLFEEAEDASDSTDNDMAENMESLDQDALDDVFNSMDEPNEETEENSEEAQVEAAKSDNSKKIEESLAAVMNVINETSTADEEADDAPMEMEVEPEESYSETEPVMQAAPEPQPATQAETPAQSFEIPHPPANNESLLSGNIKRGVSDAFINLENTFLTTSKEIKSLDQLVQDMLRPMLKQWLDNNLEDIVKRMVQKEIDRITQK